MKYIGSASAVFLLSALLLSGCNADRPAVPAKTAAVEEENTQKEKAPAWEIRLISGPPPMARLPETQFI